MTKGLVQDEVKKYREVQPIGYLYTQGEQYFLLNLKPIEPDWEEFPERRFVCVPAYVEVDVKDDVIFRSFARHIVTNSFAIEYSPNIAPIQVWDLGDIDLNAIEWNPEQEEKELADMIREKEETDD